MIATGIVPAAGRGSRLAAAGVVTPKPLVGVGGRSLVDRAIDGLFRAGMESVVVVVGRHGDEISDHVAGRPGVKVVRQPSLDGTAGAVLAAREAVGDAGVAVAWADVAAGSAAYSEVIEAAEGRDGALAVIPAVGEVRGAAVAVDDVMNLVGMVEKPPPGLKADWASAGIHAFGPWLWDHLEDVAPSDRGERELTDAITAAVGAGYCIAAVEVSVPCVDAGTADGLAEARRRFG